MTVYDHIEYKKYVNDWIQLQPSGGHGQLRRLAEALNVNSVVMSQIFRGNRDLTLEQAVRVSSFVGLNETERDFFLLMVQRGRAGSVELRTVFDQQLTAMRTAAQALKNRIRYAKFTEEDRATFYSQWYYSAIRLGVSIPELSSVGAIAKHLGIEKGKVAKVVDFLLKHKLVVEKADRNSKNGQFDIGPQVTHIGHDSPFVSRHHTNWRLKGLQAIENLTEEELLFTGPMALSFEAAAEIRKDLLSLVERCTKRAADSNSEVLACLNIDWFRV